MQPNEQMAEMPEQDATKFTIEIAVLQSGKIKVSVEGAEAEAAESQMPEGAPDADEGAEVNSMREASALAMEIYRNGGQMPSNDMTNLEAGFNSNG